MYIPVALSTAVLLGLLGVLAGVAALGEVARQVLGWSCGAVGETGVVLVVELVRASHCMWKCLSVNGSRYTGRQGSTYC
jgi:hypothetical protein